MKKEMNERYKSLFLSHLVGFPCLIIFYNFMVER